MTGFLSNFTAIATNTSFLCNCLMNADISLEQNDTLIFRFNSLIQFNLAAALSPVNTLNFMNFNGYQVLKSTASSQYVGVMEPALDELIAHTLNIQNRNILYGLVLSEFPLGTIFEEINEMRMFPNYGLLIAGDYRTYGDSSKQDPKRDDDDIYEITSRANRPLKFLK